MVLETWVGADIRYADIEVQNSRLLLRARQCELAAEHFGSAAEHFWFVAEQMGGPNSGFVVEQLELQAWTKWTYRLVGMDSALVSNAIHKMRADAFSCVGRAHLTCIER